jgi:hypothetical protein
LDEFALSLGYTPKCWNTQRRLGMEKHSRLLSSFISDEEKGFMTLTEGVNVIKLFFLANVAEAK